MAKMAKSSIIEKIMFSIIIAVFLIVLVGAFIFFTYKETYNYNPKIEHKLLNSKTLKLPDSIINLNQNILSQKFSSEARKIEVENILNKVINSAVFDSVYKEDIVYFIANEIITTDSPLHLIRHNHKVEFLNDEDTIKVKQYVYLGDFTLNWKKPVNVRVQIEVFPNQTLLNFMLKKELGEWIITYQGMIDDTDD